MLGKKPKGFSAEGRKKNAEGRKERLHVGTLERLNVEENAERVSSRQWMVVSEMKEKDGGRRSEALASTARRRRWMEAWRRCKMWAVVGPANASVPCGSLLLPGSLEWLDRRLK
jgi:hypothetical protein